MCRNDLATDWIFPFHASVTRTRAVQGISGNSVRGAVTEAHAGTPFIVEH